MKKTIKLLPLLITFLLAACGDKIEPGATQAEQQSITGLPLTVIATQAVPGQDLFIGSIESSDRGVLAARIDGRVGRLAVKVGEAVKAGQLLLTIEQNTVNDRLAEAQGGREAAAARLDLAEKTYQRYARLAKAEAVTPQELDRVTAEREQARQNFQAASAGVAQARTGAAYNQVTAPYAGTIAEQLVKSGSTVMPGTPLLVIERSGIPQARIAVPEALVGQIALGETMQLEIPALQRTISGTVSEVQPVSDPATRSFGVKLSLPADATLTPGLFVRAHRPAAIGSALLVPMSALIQRGQLTGVYVVEANILHFRLVTTGAQLGDQVEILSGLSAGETIVSGDVQRARSGARVEE
ncbi:MAG: efflux RND transporter periplasmic adaptor subunit [Desulfuromonadales bacterium]|nr:efflux RND transporter periplasmic adaptor subunit [Desulfuromonadales bacterium]